MEQQYLSHCRRVITEGEWITNKRTGKRCKTIINADMEYDVSNFQVPVVTTKKLAWKPAIAEKMGYLRGYSNAAQFKAIGCNTWDANANTSPAWLSNPFRKGEGDMGRAYGVQGRRWRNPEGVSIDQLDKIVKDLSLGIDDRREILTYWNPGETDRMCLAACMHTHTFSVLGDKLYLTSYQRSMDLPLGGPFNMVQVAWFLLVMAQITGLKPGKAYHKVANAHIYEDQLELMETVQLPRAPKPTPTLALNPDIKSLRDLETWVSVDDFDLIGYQHDEPIKYPFSE